MSSVKKWQKESWVTNKPLTAQQNPEWRSDLEQLTLCYMDERYGHRHLDATEKLEEAAERTKRQAAAGS
ncbi:hypothetical protein [Desmospora profundinema]|uniref:Uncharacterized protein n=1 Tax=Desmospora profundinema TaxID=1571184 RepID=A0ABU1IJP3_9BACL|nr:hypothetical protein [Desmospora profundinema]MDR6224379.1 hypothetical protein [Desmospora profundinema]